MMSGRQLRKRQGISSNHMSKCVEKQVRAVTPIESEAHLFEVSRKMLRADLMPRPNDSSLQQRERGFNRVRVDVSPNAHILTSAMIHRLMPHALHGLRIRAELIRDNHIHIGTDVLLNVLGQRPGLNVFGAEETQITAPLPDADHNLFVVQLRCATFAAILPAHIGLVNFNRAIQHWAISLNHRVADAMAEVPSGLVAYTECPLKLIGRHTFACFDKKQHSEKPCFKRKMRIVKNGLSRNGELVTALDAFVLPLRLNFKHVSALAAQALNPKGPAQSLQKFPAPLVRSKQVIHINQCHE